MLSPAQQNIWAGQQLDPRSPLYNMAIGVEFTATLDIDRFSASWSRLQQRYPSIASTIFLENSVYVQKIASEPVAIAYVDCSENTIERATDLANSMMQADTEQAFDLDSVLTQSKLFKLSDNRYVWFMKQHHINTDAWTFKTLWQQLCSIYRNFDVAVDDAVDNTADNAVTGDTGFVQYATYTLSLIHI